jgi:proton glutamate symport protein
LFFFVLLVLLPIAFFWRINLRKFWGAAQVPVSIAFSTASSEAALGPAIESMIKMGVPRKFVSFVLPTGMSFNLDGSTLYLAVAAVFVAQANGMELSIGTQITMLLTLMLTSKGIAGVARASLVILMGALTTFNIPDTPVYLILAVDALMDMARTSVNMFGNCLATVVIAKWENEYED